MSLEKLTRRNFLVASATAGLAAVLASCAPKATPAPAEPAADEPAEPAAKATDTPAPAAKEPYTVRWMARDGPRRPRHLSEAGR